MAGHDTSSLPRILLARGGRSLRGALPVALPGGAPVPPLDLDLCGIRLPGASAASGGNALWLPVSALDGYPSATRLGRGEAGEQTRLIVADVSRSALAVTAVVVRAARWRDGLRSTGVDSRVAVGLRGPYLSGGRRHLADLTALRRFAEEWDISVALDLTGSFDPQWEAEAAIVRLGRRLALVRIGSDALSPSSIDRARVVRRAVMAAIERSPGVAVSIEPRLPWWRIFASEERGQAWLDAEDRLRRWLSPPPLHDQERPNQPSGRPSPRRKPPV